MSTHAGSRTIDEIAADAAKEAVTMYVGSDEFKKQAKKEYEDQVKALIDSAEKKARNWAIVVTLLVIGIALSLVSSEYLKVREKRLGFDEEINKVYATAHELRRTIDELRANTDKLKSEVDVKDKSVRTTIDILERKTRDLEARINQADARLEKKR